MASEPADTTSRRVVFRRFGGPEVLELERRAVPRPARGEVLVRIAAAGVNPVDWKLFSGRPMHDPYERSLPSGNGYDFSGTIQALGDGRAKPGLTTRAVGGSAMRCSVGSATTRRRTTS
jgi:NADPH:quinone reductase-like Zn-dependent oxidoreductase